MSELHLVGGVGRCGGTAPSRRRPFRRGHATGRATRRRLCAICERAIERAVRAGTYWCARKCLRQPTSIAWRRKGVLLDVVGTRALRRRAERPRGAMAKLRPMGGFMVPVRGRPSPTGPQWEAGNHDPSRAHRRPRTY